MQYLILNSKSLFLSNVFLVHLYKCKGRAVALPLALDLALALVSALAFAKYYSLVLKCSGKLPCTQTGLIQLARFHE